VADAAKVGAVDGVHGEIAAGVGAGDAGAVVGAVGVALGVLDEHELLGKKLLDGADAVIVAFAGEVGPSADKHAGEEEAGDSEKHQDLNDCETFVGLMRINPSDTAVVQPIVMGGRRLALARRLREFLRIYSHKTPRIIILY